MSAICAKTSIRTPTNDGERAWMRSKMRPRPYVVVISSRRGVTLRAGAGCEVLGPAFVELNSGSDRYERESLLS